MVYLVSVLAGTSWTFVVWLVDKNLNPASLSAALIAALFGNHIQLSDAILFNGQGQRNSVLFD